MDENNQPPAVGLTEAEILALKNASTGFAAEACELSMSGYSKDAALHREWQESIDNLLTRDAEAKAAEVVVVRRDVLQTLASNAKLVPVCQIVLDAAAEAEVALAAKGGA